MHGKYFGENQSDLLAVFDLLNGMENKDTVLWVDGNTDPYAIEIVNGSCTGKLTSIGNELEEVGVTVLLAPVEIKKENESIWFVPELSWADIQMNYLSAEDDMFENSEDYQNVISYGLELQKWYTQLNNNGDVKIRVNHFPIQANMTQEDWDALGYIDHDLSIAGLGSSASISFLDFRLFNTPEINVIILQST